MSVVELWSARDGERARALADAADRGRLAEGLLAIEGASEEAASTTRAALDAWAALAREYVRGDTPAHAALSLAGVLGLAGFEGDRADYHAVENNHLTSVIARRRGMPILLSCVWILVGERASMVVEGVGLPGHFIVRVGGEGGILVDPFHTGDPLDVAACQRLVRAATGQDVPWDDAFLRPYRTRQILERVLRNLARSHERRGDLVEQHRTASLWCALRPDAPEPWLSRARLAESLGARADARAAYEQIATRFPRSAEARVAGERLARLPERPTLN